MAQPPLHGARALQPLDRNRDGHIGAPSKPVLHGVRPPPPPSSSGSSSFGLMAKLKITAPKLKTGASEPSPLASAIASVERSLAPTPVFTSVAVMSSSSVTPTVAPAAPPAPPPQRTMVAHDPAPTPVLTAAAVVPILPDAAASTPRVPAPGVHALGTPALRVRAPAAVTAATASAALPGVEATPVPVSMPSRARTSTSITPVLANLGVSSHSRAASPAGFSLASSATSESPAPFGTSKSYASRTMLSRSMHVSAAAPVAVTETKDAVPPSPARSRGGTPSRSGGTPLFRRDDAWFDTMRARDDDEMMEDAASNDSFVTPVLSNESSSVPIFSHVPPLCVSIPAPTVHAYPLASPLTLPSASPDTAALSTLSTGAGAMPCAPAMDASQLRRSLRRSSSIPAPSPMLSSAAEACVTSVGVTVSTTSKSSSLGRRSRAESEEMNAPVHEDADIQDSVTAVKKRARRKSGAGAQPARVLLRSRSVSDDAMEDGASSVTSMSSQSLDVDPLLSPLTAALRGAPRSRVAGAHMDDELSDAILGSAPMLSVHIDADAPVPVYECVSTPPSSTVSSQDAAWDRAQAGARTRSGPSFQDAFIVECGPAEVAAVTDTLRDVTTRAKTASPGASAALHALARDATSAFGSSTTVAGRVFTLILRALAHASASTSFAGVATLRRSRSDDSSAGGSTAPALLLFLQAIVNAETQTRGSITALNDRNVAVNSAANARCLDKQFSANSANVEEGLHALDEEEMYRSTVGGSTSTTHMRTPLRTSITTTSAAGCLPGELQREQRLEDVPTPLRDRVKSKVVRFCVHDFAAVDSAPAELSPSHHDDATSSTAAPLSGDGTASGHLAFLLSEVCDAGVQLRNAVHAADGALALSVTTAVRECLQLLSSTVRWTAWGSAAATNASGVLPTSTTLSEWMELRSAATSYADQLAHVLIRGPRVSLPYAGRLGEVISSAMRFQLRRAFNAHISEYDVVEYQQYTQALRDGSTSSNVTALCSMTASAEKAAAAASKLLSAAVDGAVVGFAHTRHSTAGLHRTPRMPQVSRAGGIGRGGGGIDGSFIMFVAKDSSLKFNTDDLASVAHRAFVDLHASRQVVEEAIKPHSLKALFEPLPAEAATTHALSIAQLIDGAPVGVAVAAAEFTAAHNFLRKLLGLDAVVTAVSRNGDCWRWLRIFARMIRKYALVEEEYLLVLDNVPQLLVNMNEEAPVVEAITSAAAVTLSRHARNLEQEKSKTRRSSGGTVAAPAAGSADDTVHPVDSAPCDDDDCTSRRFSERPRKQRANRSRIGGGMGEQPLKLDGDFCEPKCRGRRHRDVDPAAEDNDDVSVSPPQPSSLSSLMAQASESTDVSMDEDEPAAPRRLMPPPTGFEGSSSSSSSQDSLLLSQTSHTCMPVGADITLLGSSFTNSSPPARSSRRAALFEHEDALQPGGRFVYPSLRTCRCSLDAHDVYEDGQHAPTPQTATAPASTAVPVVRAVPVPWSMSSSAPPVRAPLLPSALAAPAAVRAPPPPPGMQPASTRPATGNNVRRRVSLSGALPSGFM